MPESKVRKQAADKRKLKRHHDEVEAREERTKELSTASRGWVAPTFVTLGVVGMLWIIIYYLGGSSLPLIGALGAWNVLIGMLLILAAFAVSTLWK